MPTIETLLQSFGIETMTGGVMVVCVIVGLLSLIYGYRLFRMFVFLAGFVLGAAVTALFADKVVALVVGLIAGCLSLVFMDIGIFLVGAMLGALVAVALGAESRIITSIVGIVGGCVALGLRKLMIVLSTSWTGAYLLVGVVAALCKISDLALLLVLQLVVAGIGVYCQYAKTSSEVKPSGEPKDDGGSILHD